MADLDVSTLLRDLARTLGDGCDYEAARRRDPASAAGVDPYERRRWTSTRGTLEALLSRKGDPASPYLAAWVRALLGARVNREAELEAHWSRERATVRLTAPQPAELPLRQALTRLLAERDEAIARATGEAIERVSDEPSARAHELWARRGELTRRLSMPEAERLLSPLDEPEGLSPIALSVLGATDDIAAQLGRGRRSWHQAIGDLVGRDEAVPWPKQLTARWVVELFRGEAGWLDVPDLSLGQQPALLGGSSFARALARFGARWADAAASRELPRPLARHPGALARLETGALTASLLLSPPFLVRAVGFTRAEAERSARSQARTLLFALRLQAARALARGPALEGDRRRVAAAIEEHVGRALASPPPPPSLALVVPRLHVTDPARLIAFGQGARLALQLRDRHDEDWFRNPKAIIDLRDRLGRAPEPRVSREAAGAGLAEAARRLAALAS